jgi:hypothetical protein
MPQLSPKRWSFCWSILLARNLSLLLRLYFFWSSQPLTSVKVLVSGLYFSPTIHITRTLGVPCGFNTALKNKKSCKKTIFLLKAYNKRKVVRVTG